MTRLFDVVDEDTTDAWYTPAWVFEGLGVEFDIDVASPEGGLPWLPARRHYTAADDGLSLPWEGLVWCNPPYSLPRPWCLRWADHPDGLLLIRSDLSTSGPFVAQAAASSLYVPSKRVQFVNGHGTATTACNFSTVLLGRGARADAAIARLAATRGGSARRLVPVDATEGAA